MKVSLIINDVFLYCLNTVQASRQCRLKSTLARTCVTLKEQEFVQIKNRL